MIDLDLMKSLFFIFFDFTKTHHYIIDILILYIIQMYTVHCTLYTVHCTLYTIHCILYTGIFVCAGDVSIILLNMRERKRFYKEHILSNLH